MTLEELHAVLHDAYEKVKDAYIQRELPLMSADTAVAAGEALGSLSKAKALIGRDIDDMRVRPASAPPPSSVGT